MTLKRFAKGSRIKKHRSFGDVLPIPEETMDCEDKPLCQQPSINVDYRQGLTRVALACAIASLGSLSSGMIIAYPSPAIPDINTGPGPYRVTTEEQSWATSAGCISSIIGSILAAILLDRLGRKTTLMVAAIPAAIGWLTILASCTASTLITGQAVLGVAGALFMVSSTTYVTEISPPRIRGLLMSAVTTTLSLGVLLVYILGACVHWNWLAMASMVPPALLTVTMVFIPESPRWLLAKGRVEDAVVALAWLRDCSAADVRDELTGIEAGIMAHNHCGSWLNLFRPPLLRYLSISQGLSFLQELSGITVIATYTVTIFQAAGTPMSPNLQTIVVGVAFFCGNVLCCFIIERFRRRSLLLISTVLAALGWMFTGLYFATASAEGVGHLYWLPMLSLVTVVLGCSLGITAFAPIVTNEMFSTEDRGRASSMSALTISLSSFLVTRFFSGLSDSIGVHGTFWCFAGVCLLGAMFAYFCLPETGGKKLEEVQKDLK